MNKNMKNNKRNDCPQEGSIGQISQSEICGQKYGDNGWDVSEITTKPMEPIENPTIGRFGMRSKRQNLFILINLKQKFGSILSVT